MFFLNRAQKKLGSCVEETNRAWALLHKSEKTLEIAGNCADFSTSFCFQMSRQGKKTYWKHQSRTSENSRRKSDNERKGKWMMGGREGWITGAKRWKGGRSSESPSEVVRSRNSVFCPPTTKSPFRPTEQHLGERNGANRTSQKALCILSLLYLWDWSWKSNRHKMGNKEAGGWCGWRHYHWHPRHFEQLVSADTEATAFCHICVQTPWKGRLTCPYPFIGAQMARGIHCVWESSLNSLVWPVISRPKVCWFGKMWVSHT